jgi:putative transposase
MTWSLSPPYRRKAIEGEWRKTGGESCHALARQKACRIVEGPLLPEHGPVCSEIRPKLAVAFVLGLLKGKSALASARRVQEKERNFTGEHFWGRGYAVSTVGFELESVKKYIREPETGDKEGRF